MIRLYPEGAARLLCALLAAKEAIRDEIEVPPDAFENLGEVSLNLMEYAKAELQGGMITLDMLIEELTGQLEQSQENNDGDLIDIMVRLLQLPFGRQILGASSLKELRKAVLLPHEIAGLEERLNNLERTCLRCRHVFTTGEVMVYHDRELTRGYYCAHCVEPVFTACRSCGNSIYIDAPCPFCARSANAETSSEQAVGNASFAHNMGLPQVEDYLQSNGLSAPGTAPSTGQIRFYETNQTGFAAIDTQTRFYRTTGSPEGAAAVEYARRIAAEQNAPSASLGANVSTSQQIDRIDDIGEASDD